jgi:hypothetical protein
VRVSGPHGQSFTSPAAGALVNGRVLIVPAPLEHTTYVLVNKPAAGRWRIASLGTPFTKVAIATGLPRPHVSARVGRRRGKVTFAYTITPIPGQKVLFSERGAGGVFRTLGIAHGRRGTLTFRPTAAIRRGRRIVAEVIQNGLPRAAIVVTRFTTPSPPRLTKPKQLRATRAAGGVTVRWKRVGGARSCLVQVRQPGAVLASTITHRTTFRFGNLPTNGALTATVRALDGLGPGGPTARIRVR